MRNLGTDFDKRVLIKEQFYSLDSVQFALFVLFSYLIGALFHALSLLPANRRKDYSVQIFGHLSATGISYAHILRPPK